MADSPFDSIESAQEYLRLLVSTLATVRGEIQDDLAEATRDQAARRVDALRLVDYKLKLLVDHLGSSCRLLNDLRMLRRLLIGTDGDGLTVDAPPEEIASRRA